MRLMMMIIIIMVTTTTSFFHRRYPNLFDNHSVVVIHIYLVL
ncbi:unnamed protein product [Trichobilharzia regenti]|nr:unnamed protein product [Trichobilharzia regenti]